MEKTSIVFIVLLLSFSVFLLPCAADFTTSYRVIAPFFLSSRSPWEFGISEIKGFGESMQTKGFECRGLRKDDMGYAYACTGYDKSTSDTYHLIFDFADAEQLRAIEMRISGKSVDKFLSNKMYTPEMLLTMMKDKLIWEDYIEVEDPLPDIKNPYNHIFLEPRTIPAENIRLHGMMLSTGYIEKTKPTKDTTLVLVFSEVNYFYSHQTVTDYDNTTGETRTGIISYGK
ncbi:MAG: hypothetical protein IJI14_05435 [Anaerolineaceae bacterium]|nr:hypothetical protein [Anaerolineaceae bacterium]